MNTIDLRKELISRISGIEDLDFLNAIKTILDYKKEEPCIKFTSEDEAELLEASQEWKIGKFILQSEIDKKVEEWLNGK